MLKIIKTHTNTANYLLLFVVLVALLLLTSFARADFHSQISSSDAPAPVGYTSSHILHSDKDGIVFELNTAPLFIKEDGSIHVDGLEESIVEPGSPKIPYFSTYIALPPEASISVNVIESDLKNYASVEVLPVPQIQLWGEEAGEGDTLVFSPGSVAEQLPEFLKNQAIYGNNAPFPENSFLLSDPMHMRDMRMVELKLFPLQYNPRQKTVTQASSILVDIRFFDSDLTNLRPPAGYVGNQELAWRDNVINYDQGREWRSLPQSLSITQDVKLPIGINTYRFEVDQDGLYEIFGSDLAAKGMNLPIDPSTIQMMQGGNSVAYQFVDLNSNHQFDAGDKIHFYGWAFDGSRQEQLFVAKNVFWLWANGDASHVPVVNNQVGSGATITSFQESISEKQETIFSSNWAIEWDKSPNDPINWHWYLIKAAAGNTTSAIFDIHLPNPDPAASESTYLVELTTRLNPSANLAVPTYLAQTFLNDAASYGESSWSGYHNLNVINTVSGNVPKQPNQAGYPANQVKVKFSSNAAYTADVFLTRITVDYTRQLVALDDQLIFGRKASGQSDFQVSGFSNGSANNVIVWDISEPHQPQQIKMQAGNITGGTGNYTYHIGRNHGPNARFVATTSTNLIKVKPVSKYIPISIDPPPGTAAQWLAITHGSLKNAADDLAAYRQPQMGAWVVDIDDVVNQIGFGFHTPNTIRKYLQHALTNWATAPNYVTIFGDATRNPRNLDCATCNAWDKEAPTLVVTDFYHLDRFQGMIPTDFSMTLLVGDDLIPDIAISRMPANTLQEANNMVQKVILYETQRQDSPQAWQKNFLFVADARDPKAGDFCFENARIGTLLPFSYNQTHLCLPDAPTAADTNELRVEMAKQINDIGTSVMNYRGHGSITDWAASKGNPAILSTDDTDFWQNSGRPVVILSADCLDGYFAKNGVPALGETFMRLNNRGSAAHWSSAGLGYSYEHSALHAAFYEGMFDKRLKSMGDAANFAKIKYYQSGHYISEIYGFILLGDAAMKAIPTDPPLFLPVVSAP